MSIPEFGPFEWPIAFNNKNKSPKYKKATTGDFCCEMRSIDHGGTGGSESVKFIGAKSFGNNGGISSSTYIDKATNKSDASSNSPLFFGGSVPTRNTDVSLFIQCGEGMYSLAPGHEGQPYIPLHGGDTDLVGDYNGAMIMGSFNGDDWFDIALPLNDPNAPDPVSSTGIDYGGFPTRAERSNCQNIAFNPNSGLTTMVILLRSGHVVSYISKNGRKWHQGVDTVKFPLNKITGENPNTGKSVEVKRQPYGVTASIDGGPFQIVDRRVELFTAGIVPISVNGRDVFLGSGSAVGGSGDFGGNGITRSSNGVHWDNFYASDFSTPGTEGEGGFVAITICAGIRA